MTDELYRIEVYGGRYDGDYLEMDANDVKDGDPVRLFWQNGTLRYARLAGWTFPETAIGESDYIIVLNENTRRLVPMLSMMGGS